jgi:NAD(P)-dependent dehydrogenase (short-subunit alcohol dehydrogenase family)
MTVKTALVTGAGPGLGASLVRRFRKAGLHVAAFARNADRLKETFADDSGVTCIPGDVTDGASVAAAVEQIEKIGPLDVAIANSAAWKISNLLDLEPTEFETVWRAGCLSAFNVARAAGKAMSARGHGTLLFTGSAAQMRAASGFGAMAVAKGGLRVLSQALARELGPKGIHVGHVVIDGPIDSARTRAANTNHDRLIDPDGIAEVFHALYVQPRNAWTNEIDVRTFCEWPA